MDIPIKTTVQGVDWPALPSPAGACRLAALFQLEQSQWWSEQKLRKHQFTQIDALLRYSVEHVPYYRKLLGKQITQGMLNEEQWLKIPLLTRNKLQQAGDELRKAGLDCVSLLVQGATATTILSEAEKLGIDMIVLGSYVNSTVKKLFLGITSEDVTKASTIPVLVVPPHAHK